jgi:hypothetical protein
LIYGEKALFLGMLDFSALWRKSIFYSGDRLSALWKINAYWLPFDADACIKKPGRFPAYAF